MKAITVEEIQDLCIHHNVKYISNELKMINVAKNKRERFVTFICPKHLSKGEQCRKLYDLKRLNCICKYCNHSELKNTFKDEMQNINSNIEILSNYKNWETKVLCRCKICGYEWKGKPSVLLYGGGCKICGRQKAAAHKKENSGKRIIDMINKTRPEIKIIGKYKGYNCMIKCQCVIDNTIWESKVSNIINGTAGCPTCRSNRTHDRCALTQEDFKSKIETISPHLQVIGEYYNISTLVNMYCKEHKCYFTSSPRSLLYKGSGCPKCFETLGERKVRIALEKLNILYISQYSFDDCVYINKLRFDIYCPDYNLAIEYQGKQHYEPVDFAGKGDEWAKYQFKVGQQRDNIKRQYCQQNNIKLIEIPYWDYDNIDNIVKQIITLK